MSETIPIIYMWDPDTYEYIGSHDARLDPLETEVQGTNIYLTPKYGTTIVIPDYGEYEIPIWNEVSSAWTVTQDYRSAQILDFNNNLVEITELGPLPTGYAVLDENNYDQKRMLILKALSQYADIKRDSSISINNVPFSASKTGLFGVTKAIDWCEDNHLSNEVNSGECTLEYTSEGDYILSAIVSDEPTPEKTGIIIDGDDTVYKIMTITELTASTTDITTGNITIHKSITFENAPTLGVGTYTINNVYNCPFVKWTVDLIDGTFYTIHLTECELHEIEAIVNDYREKCYYAQCVWADNLNNTDDVDLATFTYDTDWPPTEGYTYTDE